MVTLLETADIILMFPTMNKVGRTCQGRDLPKEILRGHVQAMVIGTLKKTKNQDPKDKRGMSVKKPNSRDGLARPNSVRSYSSQGLSPSLHLRFKSK